MSYTDNTTRDWRDDVSPTRRRLDGLVRRMVVKLSSGVFWQVLGHRLLDGTRETPQAEVFSGIGFYARPKASHRAEAIVVYPGGSSNPIVIATRDEDARRAVASIGEDESIAFNSSTIILIKANGTVEIRAAGGTAQPLATKADVQALANYLQSMVLTVDVPGAVTVAPAPGSVPTPSGTTVLKGQ